MSDRKAFPLRIDPAILGLLSKWAADDLRSVNGQIEYLLREALRSAGRLKNRGNPRKDGGS
ncbi:MAG: toxin-antitoxin system HicB family antitoxin [Candidatus Eisenbacteria bacterium]|nr:toxin-antitoxin system HicB family antitoxin [Candidatus Eisenbacteria bacterium]